MSLQDAFVDNDNLFWLRSATVARTGDVIAAGVGEITTIVDDTSTEIAGATFPIAMILDDATNGHWVAQLPHTATLEHGRVYTASIILTDDGTGARGSFETPFLARTRTTS